MNRKERIKEEKIVAYKEAIESTVWNKVRNFNQSQKEKNKTAEAFLNEGYHYNLDVQEYQYNRNYIKGVDIRTKNPELKTISVVFKELKLETSQLVCFDFIGETNYATTTGENMPEELRCPDVSIWMAEIEYQEEKSLVPIEALYKYKTTRLFLDITRGIEINFRTRE